VGRCRRFFGAPARQNELHRARTARVDSRAPTGSRPRADCRPPRRRRRPPRRRRRPPPPRAAPARAAQAAESSTMPPALKPHHLKLFLSNRYAYAQVVSAVPGAGQGDVLAAASTIESSLRGADPAARAALVDRGACARVGAALAERARAAGVDGVVWARKRGQRHHGRLAALVAAMQASGLPLV
jgi:large subunit ribosomal protein L18